MTMKNHPFAKLSVLVADPAPHMTTLIASMLRAVGVREVTTAANLPETITELHTHRFDLLMVLDRADEWDGLEIVRGLRRAGEGLNHQVPIILMARDPDARQVRAARDAGVTEILRKPFAAHDIETRLSAIVNAPRPFIEAGTYTGPDRRRRRDGRDGDERRRVH